MKWSCVKLKRAAITIKGKKPSQVTDSPTENCKIPYVTIEAFESGQAKQWGMNSGNEIMTRKGELLIVWDGSRFGLVGKSIGGILGSTLAVIRPKTIIETNYLYYLLQSKYEVLRTVKRGSGIPHLDGQHLNNLLIPIPPPSEQRRIVEILDQADALRKKRAEAGAKATRILPALFYKMFGDPATNPMGWPVIIGKKMFDKIGYGVGSPPPFSKDGIPFLRAGNIKPSGIKRENLVFFEAKYASSIARSRVSTGDVIIVRRGAYTGDCAVIPEEYDGAYVGYDLICQPNEETNPHWFAAAWNYPTVWQRIENIRKRAAQQGLNKEQIESFSLPRPPRDKQDIFASRVRSLSEYSNKQEKIVWKLETLFQTLLHRAFSGDLTAKWREAHLEELLGEMEEQAKMLNSQNKFS